jgi:DNA-binding SARP family transcriptional activator
MGARATVSLLGGFRVEVDDRVIAADAWRHRRGADLVKLLALAPGHRLHREQAMDALWPDLDPDAAAANLRKAIHFARRTLADDEAVGSDGAMLTLWPHGELEVDLETFEHAAGAAAGSSDAAVLDEAIATYAGELLPDDPYAAWTTRPRDRARLAYLRLLTAAGLWERVLEIDPADEEAHRRLMRRHLDVGNRQAAIRQFTRLREALREELGVSPDAASVELYDEVLAMDGTEPPSEEERASALVAWGLVHWNRRNLPEAQRSAEEARTLAIAAGLGRALGEASALLGLVAHAQGTWRDRFRDEFVDIIRHDPELVSAVFDANLCLAEFSLYSPAGLGEVVPFAEGLLAAAMEAGSIHGRALAELMLGETALLTGALDGAGDHLNIAASAGEDAGWTSAHAMTLERLGELALTQGRRAAASRLLARAGRLAETSELASHLRVRILGAKVINAVQPERALAAVRDADGALAGTEICEPCSMTFRVASAAAAARAGDLPRAAASLEHAERIAGMWQGGPWLAAVWEARGELRLAEGAPDQAAALFSEAAAGFARGGRTLDEARCRAAAERCFSASRGTPR